MRLFHQTSTETVCQLSACLQDGLIQLYVNEDWEQVCADLPVRSGGMHAETPGVQLADHKTYFFFICDSFPYL